MINSKKISRSLHNNDNVSNDHDNRKPSTAARYSKYQKNTPSFHFISKVSPSQSQSKLQSPMSKTCTNWSKSALSINKSINNSNRIKFDGIL